MGRVLVVLATIVTMATSCGGEQPQGTTPTPSGAAALSSVPPSGPAGATGVVTVGHASVTLSGDITGTFDLPSLNGLAAYAPAPGGFNIGWSEDPARTQLRIAGQTFTGERPTSDALVLGFDRGEASKGRMTSAAGECTIQIGTADVAALAGSFSCRGLTSADGDTTVDVEGSFEASG